MGVRQTQQVFCGALTIAIGGAQDPIKFGMNLGQADGYRDFLSDFTNAAAHFSAYLMAPKQCARKSSQRSVFAILERIIGSKIQAVGGFLDVSGKFCRAEIALRINLIPQNLLGQIDLATLHYLRIGHFPDSAQSRLEMPILVPVNRMDRDLRHFGRKGPPNGTIDRPDLFSKKQTALDLVTKLQACPANSAIATRNCRGRLLWLRLGRLGGILHCQSIVKIPCK